MAKTGKDGKQYITQGELEKRTDAAIGLISNGIRDGRAKQLLTDQFGCKATTARTYLTRARAHLRAMEGKPLEEMRSEALEWYRAIIRNTNATIMERIKAHTRMDKILGIDAPTRHVIGADQDAVTYTPADVVRGMDAMTIVPVADVEVKALPPAAPEDNGTGGNGTGG